MINDAKTRARLLALITSYLDETVPSAGGGWAPVKDEDVILLGKIINGLVAHKYGADADGDRPIEWEIVDRTRFERMHVFLIPYTHKATKGEELKVYDEAIYWASGNVKMAAERLDVLIQCRRHRAIQEAAKAKAAP